ncbi:MAG: sodium:calcium antiporter [Candidatus Diapherotrites archaeon]|uniref:Sodium:calcium antiporter n=1 Tax=Candidatus Iainarchaeum sp. TaxID=3101447 RepID=A0A8T4C709_9ARCH|nr:sodium:calcium antiporter [Candidatus Diapherotrites archaeon]
MMEYIIFGAALFVLVQTSRWTIDSSIRLSDHFGISKLAFGFVVVAVFVSLPDLMVGTISALAGKPALGVGGALGSTVANICLVIGVATAFRKVKITRKHVLDSAEMLLLISLIPLTLLVNTTAHTGEGLILLSVFLFYVFFVMKEKLPAPKDEIVRQKDVGKISVTFAIGMMGVLISSHYLVDAAIKIAMQLHIDEGIIGLTLVSFGTTLPELIINFTAVRRGEVSLAIGEILGSSVMNLTLVLGSVFAFSKDAIAFSPFILPVVFIVMANSMLVYYFIKHGGVGRVQGIIFLSMYVLFLFLQVAVQIIQ